MQQVTLVLKLDSANGLEPIPIRSQPGKVAGMMQTVLGNSRHIVIDGFYDLSQDCFYATEGNLDYATLSSSTAVEHDKRVELFTVTAQNSFPAKALGRESIAPVADVPPVTGWSPIHLRGSDADEVFERNLSWIKTQLEPTDGFRIALYSSRSSQKKAVEVAELELLDLPREWKEPARRTAAIDDRVRERGTNYNWQHAKELMLEALAGYAGFGAVHADLPGAIRIGEPLSDEHARMALTLLVLSGRGVIVADDLTTLSASRVDMLRRVIPMIPLPAIRSTDAFAVQEPSIGSLAIRNASGDQHLVGAFNWSPLPGALTLDLGALGLPVDGQQSYAVYDVWSERLVGVVTERFDVPLEPTSSRLFCIREVIDDQPTVLGG
jgi:hypothetical protein